MKKILLLFVMMTSVCVMAQSGCYERNRSKGIEFYNRGDNENAERAFRQALNCADKPSDNDIEKWLAKVVGNMRLSHNSIEFAADGGAVEVCVYGAGSKIEVSGMPQWCSCEKVIKNNDLYLVFKATPNNANVTRYGTISIASQQDNVSLELSQMPVLKSNADVRKVDDSKQFRFEIKGGLNMPKFNVKSSDVLSSVIDYGQTDVSGLKNNEKPDYESQIGLDIEADVDFKIARNLYLGIGLGYSSYTLKNRFSSYDDLVYTQYFDYYIMESYFDYSYNEKYKLSYLNIPIMVKYRYQISRILAFDVQTGFNMAVGLSGKLSLDGKVYADIYYSDDPDSYYTNSYVNGTVNLFNGKYDISQKYTTGDCPQYSYDGSTASPLKKFNCQWIIGASFHVSVVKIGVQYNLGISNIANDKYWESGDRVGGLLVGGGPIKSKERINGYKQRLNSFSVSVGVDF